MDKILKSFKSKIEKLDREILRTTTRLDRAIKSRDLIEEENDNVAGINLSVSVSRENVKFFTNYLASLEAEKKILVEKCSVLVQDKEKDVLKGPDGPYHSVREEIFFLKQKVEDYDALIFGYNCLIGASQVKVKLAIKDAGRITEEASAEQEHLTYLQGRLSTMVAHQQVVKNRLAELIPSDERECE